jgi:hypothetical protein
MRRAILLLSASFLLAGVASAQIRINTTGLPVGYTKGIFYSQLLTATISPPLSTLNPTVTWSLGNGTVLPDGLTLNASTGLISGNPTTPGTYNVTINVQINATDYTDQRQFVLTINTPAVSIVSDASLPDGAVSQGYQVILQATVSPALQVLWSVPQSTLPPGLSMSAQGVITGTPQTLGTYSFTVQAVLANTGVFDTKTFTLRVFTGHLTITSPSPLPVAQLQQQYSYTLTAQPGQGVTWSTVYQLPGLTLDSNTGVLSGYPNLTGTFNFVIQASANGYTSDSHQFTLFVISAPLSITETSLPLAILSAPYSFRLHATGGLAPYLWRIIGTPPPGLSIDLNTGTLSGTPTTVGSYSFSIETTDATGSKTSRAYSVFVAGPVTVITGSLPNGIAGAAYNQTLSAGGGQAPYTWSIVSGNIPPGLQFSSSGTITGTPTRNGFFQFTVQVSDNGQRTATSTLSITVGGISVSTSSLPDAGLGVAYLQNLQAIGGNAPYTWAVTAGTLPPGLTLNPSGAVQGMASQFGTYIFTVQVTDATQSQAQQQLSIRIVQPLQFSTVSLPGTVPGGSYSQTLSARGGTPPYQFTLNLGALPPGLSLDPNSGAITGTPTTAGSYTFGILLTDGGVQQAQQGFTIVVTRISITTGSLRGVLGAAFSQTLTATGGTAPYTWSLAGGNLPAGLTLSPAGLLSGTPTVAGSFPVTFSVTDATNVSAQQSATISVASSTVPAVTISLTPDNSAPAQQPQVNITLSTPFTSDLTGTLTLAFQSSASGDDQTVRFSNGTRTLVFTVPSGATQAQAGVVLTGTLAGTITLTASLQAAGKDVTPSPAPGKTIVISPAAPVISSVTFQVSGNNLTAIVTGYSTTREMVSGLFHFTPATGSAAPPTDFTVQLSSPFATWYGNPASSATGGQFVLTQPFTVSTGTGASITSLTVTLTNSKGASTAVSQ